MKNKEENKNPHSICTLDDEIKCKDCNIKGELACRWDKKILHGFHGTAWPPLLMSIFGMVLVGVLTGVWWTLIAYIAYFFVMFSIFEIRFLCSHCPYYAEEGNVLHCLANHGSFKLWKYNPGPLNRFEKFMMYLLITTIFFVFPLAIHSYGIWYLSVNFAEYGLISLLGMSGIAGATLISSISFLITIQTFFCPNCVNFSCPLNSVPKPVIDEYLRRNDVIKKAWEASGWHIS